MAPSVSGPETSPPTAPWERSADDSPSGSPESERLSE